jgi:ATP-binding cassette subfamily C (CFTR/MRP) protein 1
LQLALLIAWCLPSEPTTKASIASAVFSVIDALAMFILSYTEHIKSPHPSSTLNVYLFFSVLFDIAQARTLWLLHSSHSIAAIFTASLALKSLMLILEAAEKRDFLIGQYQHLAVETTSGIFNRSVFWWLNSMFMRGFRTLMTIDDLFVIEEMFESERLQQKLQVKWHSCKNIPILVLNWYRQPK